MLRNIKEPIRVAVIFGPGNRMKPVWFDWGRRKYEVKEVTYTWQGRIGETPLLHFAVSDGASLFELTFNTASQVWSLAAVDSGSSSPCRRDHYSLR